MFKLIQKSNPQNHFETPKESFLVGRSKRCEIVIGDPKISDIQAEVSTKDSRYFIKNLGPKPISVNGHPIGEQFLNDGDELALGKSKFVIQMENKGQHPSKQTPMEDKTMVLDTRSEESLGPRLVCTTSTGRSKIIPLKLKKLIIGRSNEATLKLMHPSISRKHCVIEKRDNGFFARNISTTNPLYLNERNVSEQRLFSGDKLQMGTFSITFISDEKADTRQATQKIITKHTRSTRGVWLAALLILIFSGMSVCITTYIYRWKSPLRFIILTVFSVIGFPVFVFMHNAFYALGVLSKNILILKSIFDVIHAVFFILAVVFCPTGLVIGIIGFVAAFLVRLKK